VKLRYFLVMVVVSFVTFALVASAPAPPDEVIDLRVVPKVQYAEPGNVVSVDVWADGVDDVAMYGAVGYEVHLDYDPMVLTFSSLKFGEYMQEEPTVEMGPKDSNGKVSWGRVSLLLSEIQPQDSVVATVEFTATRSGTSALSFVKNSTVFYDEDFVSIPLNFQHGSIQVYPSCKGDFVEPWGMRDFMDILQFLKYYRDGDDRADLNRDGELTEEDVQEMISVWGKPCED